MLNFSLDLSLPVNASFFPNSAICMENGNGARKTLDFASNTPYIYKKKYTVRFLSWWSIDSCYFLIDSNPSTLSIFSQKNKKCKKNLISVPNSADQCIFSFLILPVHTFFVPNSAGLAFFENNMIRCTIMRGIERYIYFFELRGSLVRNRAFSELFYHFPYKWQN